MGSARPAPQNGSRARGPRSAPPAPLRHRRATGPKAAARPPRLGSSPGPLALPSADTGPPLTCGCRGRLGGCPRSGAMGRRADPARPGPAAAAPPPPSSSLPRMRAPDADAAIPRGRARAPPPCAPPVLGFGCRGQSARARPRGPSSSPPPTPPPRARGPPSTGAPPPTTGGKVGRGRSVLPPPGAPRPGLSRSPHHPARHRGLGPADRTSVAGSGGGHRAGWDGAAPQCLACRFPPPHPPPGRPRACERRRSPGQQNGVGQALRPAGAPGRRRSPRPARPRSQPRCPRAVSGTRGAGRRPPPPGSGYPLPLSAAPRGPAWRPRRAPPPPSRAPAGRAVALRGAAVPSRASRAEPRPPGRGAGCPRPGLSSPGSAAPGQPRSRPPSRRRAARTGPAPARSAGTGRHRRPPQPARPTASRRAVAPSLPSDAGRGLRRQPRGSGRRAAPPPHRHGWAGTGRGAAGAARGCGTGAVLPGPRGGQGRAAAPRGAAAGLGAALPGRTRSPLCPLFPPPPPVPGPAVREPPGVLAPHSPRRAGPPSSRSAHPDRQRPLPSPRCPVGAAFPC
ncbi:basic proline-rich protein-like [Chiroxiphia lanceolata]|uniref:basic proline-rich protein-like n=1 Tax=Chiroxiphia lanceolata TaxID=296741 RepID=UPI0013CF3E7E|nr:basic proline-rich protein-like [Chiroxiphia lanceolata]